MQSSERETGTAGPATQRVAAVVLNWNGWRDTLACLESLRSLDEVPRVIVVDNGSTDDSRDRIRAAASWARLVSLPSNRGFSAGMNAGIFEALRERPAVDYVWVLNNDTLVPPTALSHMVALADSDPEIGIVGTRLVDADGSGRLQALGGGVIHRWLGTTSPRLTASARGCDHLVGASLLMRRALLREVGGFDERYFFYLEDADLGIRTRRAGWHLAVAHDATVVHRLGASIGRGSTLRSFRSDVTFARSSGIFVSSLGLPWRITAVPLRLAGMLVNRLARAQANRLIPIAAAYFEGLRIGRRTPEIPRFDADETRGTAAPARATPRVPLRAPRRAASSDGAALASSAKRLARAVLRRGLLLFDQYPAFRQGGSALLRRLGIHPAMRALYSRLHAAAHQSRTGRAGDSGPTDVEALPPRARQIHTALRLAREHHQKAGR